MISKESFAFFAEVDGRGGEIFAASPIVFQSGIIGVSNGSRYRTSGPVIGQLFYSVQFVPRPNTRPALSWRVCYPDRA
jgi:hypothetical protein